MTPILVRNLVKNSFREPRDAQRRCAERGDVPRRTHCSLVQAEKLFPAPGVMEPGEFSTQDGSTSWQSQYCIICIYICIYLYISVFLPAIVHLFQYKYKTRLFNTSLLYFIWEVFETVFTSSLTSVLTLAFFVYSCAEVWCLGGESSK